MFTLNVAAVSYGAGAALFALFTALMLTAWRGRLQGALMVAAAASSTLWCAATAAHALYAFPAYSVVQVLEALRDLAWIVFLAGLLGMSTPMRTFRSGALRTVAAVAGLLVVLVVVLVAAGRAGIDFGLDPREHTRLALLAHLGLAVAGLVFVEQLFRNTDPSHRWAIKFLVFSLGGMFAFDVYLYADALLFNRLDAPAWAARGLVNAVIVPFLAVSTRRNPQWSLEVFVSRQVVFHSTTLLGVGIYLMLMAAAGYYIRIYGGTWGGVAQVVFVFLAALMLFALLLSGQARARLRVFLGKHFFRNKYDYRAEWLRFTGALTQGDVSEDTLERLIRAFADVVGSDRGVLWIRQSSDHFQPVSSLNTPLPVTANARPDSALIRFLGESGWVVYLDEFQRRPGRYAGLVLPDWITELRDPWVIVPLMQGNELLGFVVLSRGATPRELNWEDSDLLKVCGRQAASYIALLRVTEALTDARQFEAFNRLSAYVVHDLKNLVAQLNLVVLNAKRHRHSPRFIDDAIDTVENATSKMNRLLGHLRKGRVAAPRPRSIDLVRVLRAVVEARRLVRPAPSLHAEAETVRVVAEPDRLTSVVEHLVQNAQEATPADGAVRLRVRRAGGEAEIEVEDTGCGMDPQFVSQRLFRPFDTTKGNAGMGVGVYESREFIVSSGGEFDVESVPGRGTIFRLRLPLDVEHDEQARSHDMEEVR